MISIAIFRVQVYCLVHFKIFLIFNYYIQKKSFLQAGRGTVLCLCQEMKLGCLLIKDALSLITSRNVSLHHGSSNLML